MKSLILFFAILFASVSLVFQHTGTVRSGATLIKDLRIEWK